MAAVQAAVFAHQHSIVKLQRLLPDRHVWLSFLTPCMPHPEEVFISLNVEPQHQNVRPVVKRVNVTYLH
jgi:hypothetical protein